MTADPDAARYLRPYRQSREVIYNLPRWCLWLAGAPPADLRGSPVLRERLAAVREARLASPTAWVQAQAATPYLLTQRRQPPTVYGPDVVAGNKLICRPTDALGCSACSSRAYTL